MSLYRKHRPQKFMDLVGQEHVKTTLSNALASGKFSHAYLFTGPKGSGKTTTARLLAKALNCTGRDISKDIEPCNKCSSCVEITAGRSLDVTEIDAASHTGVDNIRDIIEKVQFSPTAAKKKVYIIDEVHMLSKGAFNALLKTLEEPPVHAVFILATTELHKVPATILSRVQAFDFKKAKHEEILQKLERIVKAEKISIEKEALNLIGRLAFGAFRDAETMLDQVATVGQNGTKITLAQVQVILGQATEAEVWEFIDFLAAKDRVKALKLIEEIYFEGKDLENFIVESISVLRQVILFKSGLKAELVLGQEEEERISRLGENFSIEEIIIVIEKLVAVSGQVKTSVLGQLPLEIAVFELTKNGSPITDNRVPKESDDELISKSKPIIQANAAIVEDQKEKLISKPEDKKEISIDNGERSTVNGQLSNHWPSIIAYAKSHNSAIAALLKNTQFSGTDDGTIILTFKYKFHADQINASKYRKVLEEAILRVANRHYNIECVVDSELKIAKPADHDKELLQSAQEVFEVE